MIAVAIALVVAAMIPSGIGAWLFTRDNEDMGLALVLISVVALVICGPLAAFLVSGML